MKKIFALIVMMIMVGMPFVMGELPNGVPDSSFHPVDFSYESGGQMRSYTYQTETPIHEHNGITYYRYTSSSGSTVLVNPATGARDARPIACPEDGACPRPRRSGAVRRRATAPSCRGRAVVDIDRSPP